MNIEHHTQPHKLERYSFLWSETRLLIASLALFLGGVPPILAFNPVVGLYSTLSSLLTISWIISGLASAYLLYRWYKNGQTVFGKKDQTTTITFLVSVISGINLGLAGILGKNIGMGIANSRVVLSLVAVIYLISAYKLWQNWNSYGKKMF